MTRNGLNIQTLSTKRADFQADRVLLFGQVTEKEDISKPSHFLKFLFAYPHCTHCQSPTSQRCNQSFVKECNLSIASCNFNNLIFNKN